MHNGFIGDFPALKRELVLAVDESLYPEIGGGTDTETLFFLALSFGLEDDPPRPSPARSGWSRRAGTRRGVEYPFQGTIATTDGEGIWVFRYSSEGKSRSLFYSTDVADAAGTSTRTARSSRGLRRRALIVSEPIGDLPGAWNEVPESTYGVIGRGHDELLPFVVEPPPR